MALRDDIPEIMNFVKRFMEEQIVHNQELLDMYEGQLLHYIEDSLSQELNAKACARAKKRIAPINLLTKLVNKTSKVYTNGATRMAVGPESEALLARDQELLDSIDDSMCTNMQGMMSNKLLNLHKYVGLEPFVKEGEIKLRALPASQFVVWSNDPIDPMNPTHVIKFMGNSDPPLQRVDDEGTKEEDADDIVRDSQVFFIYTKDEFAIVDEKMNIRFDLMEKRGLGDGRNPLGVLPIAYVKLSDTQLTPFPDTDLKQMVVLIPKLLTDLNYATMFQSHSIMYAIDLDLSSIDGNPDAFWDLKTTSGEGKSPQIGTIKPTVDVDKVLTLASTELSLWLDSRSVRPGAIGSTDVENASSAIAKIVDESDTTDLRKEQAKIYEKAEAELWQIIKAIQNNVGGLKDSRKFSDNFAVVTTFADQKPILSTKEIVEEQRMKLDAGLTSRRRALRAVHPELDDGEIDDLIEEIEEEKMRRTPSSFLDQFATTDEEPEEDADGGEAANEDDSDSE